MCAFVCGHAPHHGACPHKNILLQFCQICFISGGNYTLVTCIQYTTMVRPTHSECEISQSWRTQFSSHNALNLNRAVMPPFPLLRNCEKNYYIKLLEQEKKKREGDMEAIEYNYQKRQEKFKLPR